jgi:protein-S-isoprenylcysteine O-methyltransferase Ste14
MIRPLVATDFEFRYRFWIIGAFFWIGFSLYRFDQLKIVEYAIDRTLGNDSPKGAIVLHAAFALSALLVLCAAMIRTWAAAYLRSDVVHDLSLHSEAIVADGPYRYLRNPLYLGGILLALGFGLLASRLGFVLMAGGLTIYFLRLIGLEEANLQRDQGESYREFCRRVPRLFPALSPRVPASGLKPQWGQAFRGEIFVWGFFVAVAAFAITLKVAIMWVIMGLAVLLYVVRSLVTYTQRKRQPS